MSGTDVRPALLPAGHVPQSTETGRPGEHHNGDVLSYVRWYWPEEDRWNYDELDTDRCSLRHVELRGDGEVLAAASLAEALAAHDSGGVGAVVKYERRFGVVPEAPFPPPDADIEPVLETLSAGEFEHLWRHARNQLERAGSGS
jgi:hypothetical protein